MAKTHAVVALCNALVDILVQVEDHELAQKGLTKGRMHLVDDATQKNLLKSLSTQPQTIELGGSSMNAIRSLAALGAKTAFAGMVGPDEFGEKIAQRLKQLKVNAHLQQTPKDSTGSCVVLVSPDGERTMNTHLGASCLYDESLVPHALIKDSQIFHFCGYQWDTEPQIRAINQAIETAIQSGTQISFDAADPFVCQRHGAALRDIISKKADIIFANQEEAKLLYGSVDAAAQVLTQAKVSGAIKLGSDGCLVFNKGQTIQIPAQKVAVVDTTAAGDMFAAGFLYGLSLDLDPKTCGLMATALASDVITRVGASVSASAIQAVMDMGKTTRARASV